MLRDFEIKIYVRDLGRYMEICPIRKLPDGTVEVMLFKNGELVAEKFPPNIPIPEDLPVLRLPYSWRYALLNALSELAKPPGPTATEQELKATQYHLEDMRALVFHNKRD